MKKIKRLLFFSVLSISLFASDIDNSKIKSDENFSVGIANPFKPCKNINEAKKIANFYMKAPNLLKNYKTKKIFAIKNNMIQINFYNENDEICLRKAIGNSDISGYYDTFSEEKIIITKKNKVSIKENNNKVNVAIWKKEGYSFSITSKIGLDINEILKIINQM